MTSVAKNGITWEGVFQPLTTYQNDCSKNITELGHPKAVSDCEGVISYDTLVSSTQSEKYDECGHYIYDVYYSVVATDECGNTDTLPILTEHYGKGLDTTPLQTSMRTKEGFREIDGITTDTIEITSNYGGNCTFLMPNVQNLFAIPKCGVGSMLLVEQSIEAGKPLTETLIVDVNLRNFCQNYGTLKVKVNVPKKDSIVKLTTMRSCHVSGKEPLNLASANVSKTEGYVWEYYQGEYLTVPSTILTDYYKGGVWEDSLVYSNNSKTYGDKFAGLTPEEITDKLTLKNSSQNDYYYIVAMDSTTGCTDTASTYIYVTDIIWTKKAEPFEEDIYTCMAVDILLDSISKAYEAESSCSAIASYRLTTESDQETEVNLCGHYMYDVRYYLEATDSCGNTSKVLIGTLHYKPQKPSVSNAVYKFSAIYANDCELVIPDLTKYKDFARETFCSANLKITQSIEPGTPVTKDTIVSINYADACQDYGTVYNVLVKAEDNGTMFKLKALDTLDVKPGEALNLTQAFQAAGQIWTLLEIAGGESDFDMIPATFRMRYFRNHVSAETEVAYPFTLNNADESDFYYAIATDTTTGCSDTVSSYIVVGSTYTPAIAASVGEGKVNIYTPSGLLLKKEVYFKDVMGELKEGIYIINDKKVYVKK